MNINLQQLLGDNQYYRIYCYPRIKMLNTAEDFILINKDCQNVQSSSNGDTILNAAVSILCGNVLFSRKFLKNLIE